MRPARPCVAFPRHPLTGRQIRLSARTPRELAALLHDLDTWRIDYRHGRMTAEQLDRRLRRAIHGRVTLGRVVESYAATVAPNTVRRVRSWLASAGLRAASELGELDGPAVAAWIDRLRASGLAESTIATQWKTLSALGAHAAARGWIGAVPWAGYRPKLRERAPVRLREALRSPGELAHLLSCAREEDSDRGGASALEAKIAACALLGLRQGELAGLRWSDLDEARGSVAIVRQYDQDRRRVKSRVPKRLRALPALFEILGRYRARLEACALYAPRGPVFPMVSSAAGKPRPYASGECLTRLDLRAVIEKSDLPNPAGWSVHSLRDSFAQLEHSANGGDVRETMQRTRHRSLASAARYLRSLDRGELAAPGFTLPEAGAPSTPLLTPKR